MLKYVALAFVLILFIAGGLGVWVLSSMKAPAQTVERVISNDRFPR